MVPEVGRSEVARPSVAFVEGHEGRTICWDRLIIC